MTTLRIRVSAIEHNLCAIRQRTSARIIAVVKEDGYGLGLGIARNIAHTHGGEVSLQNRREGGLRVSLRLPRLALE